MGYQLRAPSVPRYSYRPSDSKGPQFGSHDASLSNSSKSDRCCIPSLATLLYGRLFFLYIYSRKLRTFCGWYYHFTTITQMVTSFEKFNAYTQLLLGNHLVNSVRDISTAGVAINRRPDWQKLQWSGVQLSERLVPLSIRGACWNLSCIAALWYWGV